MVNVLGDAIGAGIVEHLSRDELNEADQSNMEKGESDGLELIEQPEERYTAKDPDQITSNL